MPKRKREAKKKKIELRKSPRLNHYLAQPESSSSTVKSLLDRASKIVLEKIHGKNREINERNLSEKFLDRMAKILEGSSKGVAVAFVNGEFIITANEITQGTTQNRIIGLINQTMDYFSNLANLTKNIDTEEEKLLSNLSYHVGILANIVTAGYQKADILPKIQTMIQKELRGEDLNYRKFIPEFSKHVLYIAKARAAFVTIMQDFSPLKSYFEKNSRVFSGSQRTAFKRKKQGYRILQNQTQRVHAEVQILAEIVKLLEQNEFKFEKQGTSTEEIYIGVSKLCCPKCRIMLEVANIVFKENGIPLIIKYAGEHPLSFDWIPPDIFEDGFNKEVLSKDEQRSVSQVIGFLTANRIAELEEIESEKKGKTQAPVSMIATPSPNQAKLGTDDRIKFCITQLKYTLENYKKDLPFNSGLKRSIELVESALTLIQHARFKYFYLRGRYNGTHDLIDKLRRLCKQLLSEMSIHSDELLLFLISRGVFDDEMASSLESELRTSGSAKIATVLNTELTPGSENKEQDIVTQLIGENSLTNIAPASAKPTLRKNKTRLFDAANPPPTDGEKQQSMRTLTKN